MDILKIAQGYAEAAMVRGHIDEKDTGRFLVDEIPYLNEIARKKNVLSQKYFVLSHRSVALPDEREPFMAEGDFDDLQFIGNFVRYSFVNSPEYLGRRAINGLCLTFAAVQPGISEDDEGIVLHVPAHAAETAGRIYG